MHSLNYIIYANEQAARKARDSYKARRIKESYAEAQKTIKRITRLVRNSG